MHIIYYGKEGKKKKDVIDEVAFKANEILPV